MYMLANSYAGARDARIKEALPLIQLRERSYNLPYRQRVGENILWAAFVLIGVLGPLTMSFWSVVVGLSLVIVGFFTYALGLWLLVVTARFSAENMSNGFKIFDVERPELSMIMEKYKDERVREEGSSPTF